MQKACCFSLAPWGTVASEIYLQCVPVFTSWNQWSMGVTYLGLVVAECELSFSSKYKGKSDSLHRNWKDGGSRILSQSLTLWWFWQVWRGSPGRQNLDSWNLRENKADACLEECRCSPGCTLELPKALKYRSCLDAVTQTRDLIISDSDVCGHTILNAPSCVWFFQTLVIFKAPLWFICVVKVEN